MQPGDNVSVPALRSARGGDVGGTVVAVRDDRVLLRLFRTGQRRWFAADQLERWATPQEVLDEWFAARPPLVVIPCGARKLSSAAPAGELYIGAQHRLARQAADALARQVGGTVMVLSARYGLVPLEARLDPYDLTVGDPGAVTGQQVARQLRDLDARRVIALTPKRYSALLAAAPRIRLEDRLAGTRGLLEQRAVLVRIRTAAEAACGNEPGAAAQQEGAGR